jgi:outer membrane receptor protein involved in Fe transport
MKMRWALAVWLLACGVASAQTFRGGIQGAVSDSTGAAVPGAQVVARNVATGLSRTVTTDQSGSYAFTELPLGEYAVTASLTGFAAQTVTGVHVDAAVSRRVDLVLTAGGRAETVEVSATSLLVDSTHDVQGGTISGEQAAELPLNGRDYVKLLSLVAGANADASGIYDSPGSFGLFSINGNRGRANNYLLDGTDMNDGYRNLPAINQAGVFGTPSTILPVDAVAEFPVQNGVEAEYGRNAGAIVNIVTKSGTNEWHGSAYEYFRDASLGARNFFNTQPNPKNQFRNNQFGASLGGPIRKDRTFFFFSYEGQRENGANGGVTNPVIRGILDTNPWPAPNQAPDAAGNNVVATVPFSNNVDSLIAKVDQHFGTSDLLTVRYYYGNSDQSFPLGLVGGGVLPGYNTVTPTTVNLLSGSLTKVLSPQLLLEVRGGYNRFEEEFFPQDRSFDPNSVGLATVSNPQDFGLPQIRVAGYTSIGSTLSVPRGRVDTNYQGFANLSYNTGRHRFKVGYEYRRTTVNQFFDAGYRGRLDFASLEDFIAGRLSGGRQAAGDSRRHTYQNNHALYLQDGFQVSRRVTLNYGLRWDYYGVIGEDNGLFSGFDQATATVVPLSQLYGKDWNNFSPRASVAWDAEGTGRTVVRAGYGLYYDAFSQDFFIGQLPWNTYNPGPAYNDIQFSFQPVSEVVSGQPVFDPSSFSASDVFTVDPNLSTPYVQIWNVNVQRQIGNHMAVQIGYVGSKGSHLFRYRDINQLDPATGAAPFPAYVYINQFESTASSRYKGLQVSWKIQDWHGLVSTVNYTLSKSEDNASDGQDYVPNATQPDDSTHPEREWAPSNFDTRHRLTWYFTWDIGRRAGGSALGSGWSVSGLVTFASGQPVNINYLFEADYNGSGEYFGRPDLVGDPFAGTGGPDRFLNLTAFQAPCNPDGEGGCAGGQHFGSLPRNAFYGPKYFDVDLSLVKNTRIGGRATLQLRADVFNVFNHPNFSNPLLPNFSIDFLQNGIDPATNRGIGYLPLTATPDVGGGNPFLGGGGPRALQIAVRVLF